MSKVLIAQQLLKAVLSWLHQGHVFRDGSVTQMIQAEFWQLLGLL